MNQYFEDEFDELLYRHNPNGGRPQAIGATIWSDKEKVLDVSKVQEDVVRRFLLGYCPCGRKVVIGYKRAEYLASVLRKQGIVQAPLEEDIRVKLLRGAASLLLPRRAGT